MQKPILVFAAGFACCRQPSSPPHGNRGPLAHSAASGPSDAVASLLDSGVAPLEAAPDARALSDQDVDSSQAKGCAELFGTKSSGEKVRYMLEARTRMKNRACLGYMELTHPVFSWACDWSSFTKLSESPKWGYGQGHDCYANRFSGAGVICGISDERHPDDKTIYFDTIEGEIRSCFGGWREEKIAATKRFGDRAFSFSKAVDGAGAGLVTRLQGCRGTSAPRTIDERERSYMRFEIFTEAADETRAASGRQH